METYRVDFASLPWETQLPASRFKAFRRGEAVLRVVEYTKDFVAPDWCSGGHIGYVLDGEMEIDFDGDVVRFTAGDGIFIPDGEAHRHKPAMLTDVVRVVLVEHA